MTPHGSTLLHPFQADRRGKLAATSDKSTIVEQSIVRLLRTRRGERWMQPDLGVRDFVFETGGAGLASAVAFNLADQIAKYVPRARNVRVLAGWLRGEEFVRGYTTDEQQAAVSVHYSVEGDPAERNMVFPLWRLKEEFRRE